MLASVGFVVALAFTLLSLFLNLVTFATNDYTPIVMRAIASAALAMLLIGLLWKRMPMPSRVIAGVLLLANAWTILDGGGRRLMGWY